VGSYPGIEIVSDPSIPDGFMKVSVKEVT